MYEIFEQLCKEKGVTAYRVCKSTGITTATISNWKAGRYTPKQEKMQKLADYFGVTINYLMTGKEESESSPDSQTQKITGTRRSRTLTVAFFRSTITAAITTSTMVVYSGGISKAFLKDAVTELLIT